VVSRRRRLATIATLLAMPALIAIVMSLVLALMAAAYARQRVDDRIAAGLLNELGRAERGRREIPAADRERLEAILVTRYRAQLTDPTFYDPRRFLLMGPEEQAIAARILRRPAVPALATGPPPPVLQRVQDAAAKPRTVPLGSTIVLIIGGTLAFIGLAALSIAPIARGGLLLRVFGYELVTGDGRPASRLRVSGRAAIVWAPVVLPFFAEPVVELGMAKWAWLVASGLVAAAVGAGVAIADPSRGWQDRLAGTWIVPR
jgi:hypothetical protein